MAHRTPVSLTAVALAMVFGACSFPDQDVDTVVGAAAAPVVSTADATADDTPAIAVVPATRAPAPAPAWRGDRRVLVIGDSLMAETAPALHERLDFLDIEHRIDTIPGTGLLWGPDGPDWHERARGLVDEFGPTDVIVEFCCNYWEPYRTTDDGTAIVPGTPAFEAAWAVSAAHLREILTANGARLHWVITPPTGYPDLDETLVDPINRTTLAAHGVDSDIVLIDWAGPLTDWTGEYQAAIDGVAVRNDDLVHLAAAGTALTADATVLGLARVVG